LLQLSPSLRRATGYVSDAIPTTSESRECPRWGYRIHRDRVLPSTSARDMGSLNFQASCKPGHVAAGLIRACVRAYSSLGPVVCFKCSNPRFPHMMSGGMSGSSHIAGIVRLRRMNPRAHARSLARSHMHAQLIGVVRAWWTSRVRTAVWHDGRHDGNRPIPPPRRLDLPWVRLQRAFAGLACSIPHTHLSSQRTTHHPSHRWALLGRPSESAVLACGGR
jgi:hypothetical protein